MRINEILSANLTQEQYNAAIDESNEILCLACAGSGKSRTLAYRIAKLVVSGIQPFSIVAFTFTEKAAEAIKRRVAEALIQTSIDPAILGAMYIGTIHSFCKYLLGEFDARYRQYDVLDPNKFKLFLISKYYRLGLHNIRRERNARYFETINNVTSAWSILNDELLSLRDLINADNTLGNIIENLRTELNNSQFIDFSLMIRIIVEQFRENNSRLNNIAQNITHLLVDEYQDINPLQENLIREIHSRGCSLFVVGDDDQAIYAWRGADVSNIINFQTRYPDCSIHELSINFRSTSSIIDSSSVFVQRELGPARISKTPMPAENNLNVARHYGKHWFANRNEEAAWIANRIQFLIGKSYNDKGRIRGLCPSDFAILMTSTMGIEGNGSPRHSAFTLMLDGLNIPYTIEAEGSIFGFSVVSILRQILELLRDPNLTREALRNLFNHGISENYPNADFDELSRVLAHWQRLIHEPYQGQRRKVSPQLLLHELLSALNFQETLFSDSEMQAIGIFSKIMLDVESVYMSIDTTSRFREVLNFLNVIAESGYETSPDDVVQRPNAVFVSTIHKAKGLEFPVVFVVDVEQNRFPGPIRRYNGWFPLSLLEHAISRGSYQNTREGSIRLFYTALTRAERYLYITGSEILPGGSRTWRQSTFALTLNHSEINTDPEIIPDGLLEAEQVQRFDENIVPTTFSEIKYYLSCPKNYQFKKQYGFSASVPDLYGFGQTLHTIIAKLHEQNPNAPPSSNESYQTVENIFHLKHVPESNNPLNSPGPYERAKNKAHEVIEDYVTSYSSDFVRERQVEVRFEILARSALIAGNIDLLLKQNEIGDIIEATVIDFKSLNQPEEEDVLDWIELCMQVQLYAKAATEVLGENARTGAVHLLKDNTRVDIPINNLAIDSTMQNLEWAVEGIINRDFPKRPSKSKCNKCDFNLLCNKVPEDFRNRIIPPEIHFPETINSNRLIKAFSDYEA